MSYGTEVDAVGAAGTYLKSGAPFYIWQLADGSWDFTAIPDPKSKEYSDARLTRHGHVMPAAKRRNFRAISPGPRSFLDHCVTCDPLSGPSVLFRSVLPSPGSETTPTLRPNTGGATP